MNYSVLFDLIRSSYTTFSRRNKDGKALIPLRYFLELTYRCNLNCPYCYIGEDRNKNELSTGEWQNVIGQIPFYGIITLVGGEPLLRNDFNEILEFSCKKALKKVHVVSNGILLDKDKINSFKKHRPVLLSVSLDGYAETHDNNRGKAGIFDKILSNLENLKSQAPEQMIDIKTIVLKNNLDDLVKLYKLCTRENFNFLSVSFLRNNHWKQNSILQESFIPEFNENYPIEQYFDIEHFKEVYKELESLSKKSKVKLRFSPKFEYTNNPVEKIEEFFKTSANTPVNQIYYPCYYPYSDIMINPEGFVYPCLSLKIGNVRDKRIRDLYNEPKYCCFRKNLKASGGVIGACQMCCECRVK